MEIVTDADKLPVDIQATCKKYKTIKQWAYILHDKDDTRPHYHIYLNFGASSCDTAMVAKWFGIEENFIEKVKGRKTDVLLSRKTGIQMEFSEIFGKFCDNYDFPADSQQTSFLDSK